MTKCFDVLVIGAGPAGLAIAAACAEQGLDVACLSPEGVQPWHNTYGVWYDELPAELLPTIGHSWQKVYVRNQRVSPSPDPSPDPTALSSATLSPATLSPASLSMDGAQLLGRQYALFDNEALQRHLLEHCHNITWLYGFASHVEHSEHSEHSEQHSHHHTTVFCHPPTDANTAANSAYQARLVIAANGHRSPLVQRPDNTQNLAFQVAYGVVGTFSRPPIAPDSMMLMDFDDGYLRPEERQQPTFLYAMDMGDGTFFVEETALAVRPKLPFDFFKDRLERRLAARGCTLLSTISNERCLFPMNPHVPPSQMLLAYGAAAGMVHPASGYMVGLALRYAPELAATIATSLQTTPDVPTTSGLQATSGLQTTSSEDIPAAVTAWQKLWSADARYRQQLYRFGLEALLSMDSSQTQAFFKAFFAIPTHDWQGYLSNQLSTTGVLQAMTHVFVRAPWHVRGKLIAAALRNPSMLLPKTQKP